MSELHKPNTYRLYGYTLSYFTRKLEAALDWYGVPYEFCTKSPEFGPKLEERSGTKQVPVLVTPEDECVADTTPILWMMDARYPQRALIPPGVMGGIVQILEEYLDEWLTRVVMHYRWNFDECIRTASTTLGQEAAPQAPEIVASMLTHWGKKVVRARGMSPPAMQDEGEAEWKRLLDALESQLSGSTFALGDRPCAVDAVLLGGLRGHFLPDPVPARVLESYPRIKTWVDNASNWSGDGELASNLEDAPFAQFLLGEMGKAYRTYILANGDALTRGEKAFTCETYGHSVSYKCQPYVEFSRTRTSQRLKERLSETEYRLFSAHLHTYGLDTIFGKDS